MNRSCAGITAPPDRLAGETPASQILARSAALLTLEIDKATDHFGLSGNASLACCYQADEDAFWIHCILVHAALPNIIVDSASIAASRRKLENRSDPQEGNVLLWMALDRDRRALAPFCATITIM